MAVGPYEAPPPPSSFHGDYAYDTCVSNFSGTQGFTEYGYPVDAGWPAVEQGVWVEALRAHWCWATRSHLGVALQAWHETRGEVRL